MIDATAGRKPPTTILRHRAAPLLLTILIGSLLAGPATAATPGPSTAESPSTTAAATATAAAPAASTTTADTMAAEILSWLNRDRAAAGLRPLRSWTALQTIANQRSANMAASKTLSHAAAGGDPGSALTRAGLQWYSWGEIIGENSWPYGSQSAAKLYEMWRGSAPHHAIMFSATSNYIGIGIARASDGSTWSSVLFTESTDHTRPWAKNGAISASGTTVRFAWSGADTLLQTHTAGLRSFDVQYRVDSGSWHLLRNDTTSTKLAMYNRARRHYYSFRVQSADRRGNLSTWTVVKRIWLP
jgi:uncharacterized protein YkwD